MHTRWMCLALVLAALAAAGGCRSANWQPLVGDYAPGYLKDTQEVFVYLLPLDQFTMHDMNADRLVIDNLHAWTDEGRPVQARWGRQQGRAGWMLFVAAEAPPAARWIEVQGTVVGQPARVRDVFRTRWETDVTGPERWQFGGFADNVQLIPARGPEVAAPN